MYALTLKNMMDMGIGAVIMTTQGTMTRVNGGWKMTGFDRAYSTGYVWAHFFPRSPATPVLSRDRAWPAPDT